MGRRWSGCLNSLKRQRKSLFVFGGAVLLLTAGFQGSSVVGSTMTPTVRLSDQENQAHALSPTISNGAAVPADSDSMMDLSQGDPAITVGTVRQWLADYRTGLTLSQKRQLAEALYDESKRYGLSPALVMALIATESSVFNWSRSDQGAVGLMQLSPVTAEAMVRHGAVSGVQVKWSGEESLFDPVINLRLGLEYLSQLVRQFGDMRTALTAYNYGPTRVSEWQSECKSLPVGYANRILALSKELRDQSQGEPMFDNQQA